MLNRHRSLALAGLAVLASCQAAPQPLPVPRRLDRSREPPPKPLPFPVLSVAALGDGVVVFEDGTVCRRACHYRMRQGMTVRVRAREGACGRLRSWLSQGDVRCKGDQCVITARHKRRYTVGASFGGRRSRLGWIRWLDGMDHVHIAGGRDGVYLVARERADIVAIKYDLEGKLRWLHRFRFGFGGEPHGILIGRDGHVRIGGHFHHWIYLDKLLVERRVVDPDIAERQQRYGSLFTVRLSSVNGTPLSSQYHGISGPRVRVARPRGPSLRGISKLESARVGTFRHQVAYTGVVEGQLVVDGAPIAASDRPRPALFGMRRCP